MKGIKFIIGIYKNGETEVQSVLIPKIVSAIKAKLWVKSHRFKYDYVDESKNY